MSNFSAFPGSGNGVLLGKNAQIAENISVLQKHNVKLGRMLHKIGTEEDHGNFRNQLTTKRNDAKQLCQTLFTQFKENTSGNKREFQKLSKQFEQAAEKFKEISQKLEKREREVVAAASLRESSEIPSGNVQFQQAQQQDLGIQFLEYDVQDIEQRQEGIQQIERDILEVCEMMKDLKTLVDNQQEDLDTIGANIEQAKNKVEQADVHLKKAEVSQKKSRKRTCCILMIVLGLLLTIVMGAWALNA